MMGQTFKKFADNTSLHGVKEISESHEARVFWVLIVIGAGICLGYQLEALGKQYSMQETGTKVEQRTPEYFPPITICPFALPNPAALDELKISEDVANAIKAIPLFSQPFLDLARGHKIRIPERNASLEAVRVVAEQFNNSLSDALLALSQKESDIFLQLKVMPYPMKYVIKPYPTWADVCYMIELPDPLPYIMQYYGEFSFDLRGEVLQGPVSVMTGGSEINAVNPPVKELFPPNFSYHLKVSTMWIKRVSTNRKPCVGQDFTTWTDSQFYACQLNHVNENECKNTCKQYTPGNGFSPESRFHPSELCAFYNNNYFDCVQRIIELDAKGESTWHKSCLRPCYEKLHQMTILPFFPNNVSTHFRITLVKPEFAQEISEYMIHSLTTFICNIGGTTSLWFGASMLSFVHMIYFLISLPLSRLLGNTKAPVDCEDKEVME